MPTNSLVVRFKKLSEHAVTPLKASAQAAGFDLFSAHDAIVPAKGTRRRISYMCD